jgi:hypothetical protein
MGKLVDLETFRQTGRVTKRVVRITDWDEPEEWCVMCKQITIWKGGHRCKNCSLLLKTNREWRDS